MKKIKVENAVKLGKKSQNLLDLLNKDEEIFALWEVTNIVANKRLRLTDHGVKHFQIVINNALLMLDILNKKKVKMNLEKDYQLSFDYSQCVVLLASILHDVGMSVHRDGHEGFSLFLGANILDKLLDFLPVRERVIVRSETLHAIISHRKDGQPLTVEAGIVRVADALDMTRGRVFEGVDNSIIDIHEVSAQAIDKVEIRRGKEKALQINIIMNHTAGLFQVDELMKKKLEGSGISKYVDVDVYMDKSNKRQLFKQYLGQ